MSEQLLAERLESAAREHPDSVALVDGAVRVTYRELLARADLLAAELQARGIGANDLVAVALPRSAELVIAIAGIVRAGAAYLPIDLGHPVERRRLILSDARPRALVTDGSRVEGIPPGSEILPLPRQSSHKLHPRPRPAPGELAYVIYTSGSTGKPKGVRVTQHNVARLFRVSEALYNFGPGDVWTLFHSIAFDFSVWELWGALLHGGRLVVVSEQTAKAADAFHELVVKDGVTVLNQTPSAFRAFDMADAAAGRPRKSLRCVIFGGEALDPRTLRAWFEAHGDEQPLLVNMYGITETTVHVTYRPMRAQDARGSGSSLIGTPLPDLRIELLGAGGEAVQAGEIGEICVGGAGVADGYLGRPLLTAERFLPDPSGSGPDARRYLSGDLARHLPDGDLEYLGRADQQVKLRGFRIELGEIEAALRDAAGVREAVVALREDPVVGTRLVAYLVPDGSAPLDAGALRMHATERLPEYMVPAAFVQIEYVPRTANDKVDRNALPAPTSADLPRVAGGESPRDELERAMAGIFAEVLGTDVATRESDFFRLGGHSLLAWRVVVLCEERLGAALSVNEVFAHPSVAALADLVRREQEQGRSAAKVTRVRRDGTQPLTPQQYALWLELKLVAHDDTYNEPIAFRVEARLSPERVRGALERLFAAHEILRARLIEHSGEPRFVFDATPASLELEVLEGAGVDLQAALRRPFELARGPLWRAVLHQEPGGGTVLLLVMHHLIMDAASAEILLRDLAAAYADPAAAPQARAARAYDFRDLASHERARLADEQAALERFWTQALEGAQLTPELPPPCVPCAPGEEEQGCFARRTVPPALARSIRALAANLGTTPFHIYLAAYLALLRSYTASDDLVIGSPVSLRDTPAARDVVGYFLSPVALRVQLMGSRSFRETVEEVSRRWQEVRAHARLPMHLVLQAARGGRRAGIGSPFQVFFSLIQASTAGLSIEGQPLLPVQVPPSHVKFQLFLLVEERAQDASLALEFQRGVLDPAMAERLLAQLERLLSAATEEADAPLSSLPLLEPGELERLRAFGSCERPYARDSSVPDLFEEIVRRSGDATALVAGASQLSYASLDRRANAVAAALRHAGVARGDRVPLLLARGPRFVASALGVLKCGAAYVPLDPAYPPERLARMLDGLGAQVGLRASGLALTSSGISWLDASYADEESFAGAPPREPGAADAAYVMFTSGSTGRPKGVEVPHRAIVRLVQAQDFARMGPQETWLHMAPTSFDASTLEIWAALLNGGRCVVLEESLPTPELLAETIRRNGVTSAWFTASLFNALVDDAPGSFTGLQQILVGGEALSPVHMRRAFDLYPGARFVNGYGPTENTTFTCCHVIGREDLDSGRAIPIGRPIANTSVFVLDRDGRVAPLGVPGELVAGGDGVALGYAGQPAQTAERFLPDTLSGRTGGRLYRTGDRARWSADGALEFLGRLDEQVKIRGHRIEPGEIAACLSEHAQVRQAAVVPRRMSSGATQLVAYIVARDPGSAGELPRLLASHAAERLPAYMLPAMFVIVPQLPLKPNGKLDLDALEAAPHHPGPAGGESPRDELERAMAGIFAEVLGTDVATRESDFFRLGGHSLLAWRVVVLCEERLGAALSVNEVFAHPSVAALADLVRREQEQGRSAAKVTRVRRDGTQPLTPQQYALWLELKLVAHDDTYNEPIAFRVEARLSPERVRGALERLFAAHEILRARLIEHSGEPRFVFDATPASLELEVLEGAGVDLQAALRRPFELARGPLWRAVLHQEPGGGTVLLLVMHHLIMDAASAEILLRDLAAAYADPAAAPQARAARAYDFRDLASHERARLADEQAALERFWTQALEGAQLTPELPPPCVPCAPGEEEQGCFARRTVPPALARSIRALAANLGTTPFHIYLAAYLALLRSYTASDDLVIGSPVSLRDTPAARDVVGYFLSPVALRVQLMGSRSFRETVEEVSRRWQEVRAHARLPMHLVLQAARGGRRAGIGSPFQVFFSLIQASTAGLSIEGQPLLPVQVPPSHVKFQLFLLVEERAQDASLALEFQRGVLDPAMAERLLAQLERLLQAADDDPDRSLADLPLLTEAEKRQLLLDWNDTTSPYPDKASVHELFETQAARTAARIAVKVGTTAHSYAALEMRANRLAQTLRSHGVGRGQRVGLCVERGADMLAAVLGILKAGAAYVPLDPSFPQERLRFMAEDAQLAFLVSTTALADPFGLPRERQLLLEGDAAVLAARPDVRLPPDAALDARPGDPAYVIYTSGSTGKPKGVVVPHRAVVNFLTSMAHRPGLAADDVLVAVTTLSFDIAVLELLLPLTLGATVVIASRDDAIDGRALRALIEQHGATVMQATPVTWRLLLASGWTATLPFKALVGGEALPRDLADQLLACGSALWNMYGPTETTVWSTCAHIADSYGGITIGGPIANTTVYILDAQQNLCPMGVPGELCIGGAGVTLGYWNRPELTAERFIPDPFDATPGATLYRTGDRARWRMDGTLEHLGRLDFQVKIRGYRIELGEIEATLDKHPNVEHSVAAAREDTPGDQRLVAYVVTRPQAAPSAAELREHLSRTLPAYMVPNAFVFLKSLPVTANGKIHRAALPVPEHLDPETNYAVPRTATEETMAHIWAEVLGLGRVSVEDDFFELGGTSLLAMEMLARIERMLRIAIPVRVLVEGRTIRRIASMLATSLHSLLPRGVALMREGDLKRPLFFLPGLGGVALQFERLTAKLRTRSAVFVVELHELDVEPAVLGSLAETAVVIVQRMREAQARGPYSILGYSYGGNLAVEVATELLRQGQTVDLVVVLDAYAPGAMRNPSGLNKVAEHLRILRRLRWPEAYDYLASRVLRRLGLKSDRAPARPTPESGLERRLAKTEVLGKHAFGAYRPGRFEGRIVLVHASDLGDWMEIADPSGTCGWGEICTGGVEVIQIGCKHLDLFKEPNFSELALRLNEVLGGHVQQVPPGAKAL